MVWCFLQGSPDSIKGIPQQKSINTDNLAASNTVAAQYFAFQFHLCQQWGASKAQWNHKLSSPHHRHLNFNQKTRRMVGPLQLCMDWEVSYPLGKGVSGYVTLQFLRHETWEPAHAGPACLQSLRLLVERKKVGGRDHHLDNSFWVLAGAGTVVSANRSQLLHSLTFLYGFNMKLLEKNILWKEDGIHGGGQDWWLTNSGHWHTSDNVDIGPECGFKFQRCP